MNVLASSQTALRNLHVTFPEYKEWYGLRNVMRQLRTLDVQFTTMDQVKSSIELIARHAPQLERLSLGSELTIDAQLAQQEWSELLDPSTCSTSRRSIKEIAIQNLDLKS